jgi:MarR family transcriptional regulator, lower aerobic nicotinate degradation pathway regulator
MPPRTQAPQLADGLFQLSCLLHDRLARIAAEHDLSVIHLRLLRILRDHEPGMFELAQDLALKKPTLTGCVDRAESRGLVVRMASPDDRRAANVHLTAEGRRLARAIDEAVNAEIEKLVAVLPASERDRLASHVSQIVAAADRQPNPKRR